MKLPKTWFTIALFCLLAAVPYFVPPLGRFRILECSPDFRHLCRVEARRSRPVFLKPRPTWRESQLHGDGRRCARAQRRRNNPLPPSFLTGDYVGKNWPVREDVQQILQEPPESVSIQDYGCGMNHFYAALARTEQKQPGAITRISHFGDSPISGDLISGEARTLLQDKFGDSGHGFILISKPWDFYYHEGVLDGGQGMEGEFARAARWRRRVVWSGRRQLHGRLFFRFFPDSHH